MDSWNLYHGGHRTFGGGTYFPAPLHRDIQKAHYCDVIMGAMASQITSLTIVYSAVYLGSDQRNHQSSTSGPPMNSPHSWPMTGKMSPFADFIMAPFHRDIQKAFTDTFEQRFVNTFAIVNALSIYKSTKYLSKGVSHGINTSFMMHSRLVKVEEMFLWDSKIVLHLLQSYGSINVFMESLNKYVMGTSHIYWQKLC